MVGQVRLSFRPVQNNQRVTSTQVSGHAGSHTSVLIFANSPCLSEKAVISASIGVAYQMTSKPGYLFQRMPDMPHDHMQMLHRARTGPPLSATGGQRTGRADEGEVQRVEEQNDIPATGQIGVQQMRTLCRGKPTSEVRHSGSNIGDP